MNWISTDPRSHRTVGISLAVFIVGIAVGWWLPFGSKSNVRLRLAGAPYHSPTSKYEVVSSRLLSADGPESAMDFVARLHTALGIQGREKRDRAIARIADDLNAAQLQEAVQR